VVDLAQVLIMDIHLIMVSVELVVQVVVVLDIRMEEKDM